MSLRILVAPNKEENNFHQDMGCIPGYSQNEGHAGDLPGATELSL